MTDRTDETGHEIDRRTVLKGLSAAGAGAVGLTAGTGTVAADHCTTVVDDDGGADYASIQTAIDNASNGDVVCVESGTYDETIGVDRGITLTGKPDPDGPDPAVVDGSIEVSASDATVERLNVAPSTTFVAGGLDPHGILVSGDLSGVTVRGNVVDGMNADSTGGSVTINGVQVWNDGPGPLTGTVVENNVVRGMDNEGDPSAGWPNYGGAAAIKIQGVVNGTAVTGNTVESIHSAGWTYGVVTTHTANAPGVSPAATTVARNTIREVNDGSVYDVFDDPLRAPYPGSAFAVDGDSLASEADATFNNFLDTPNGAQNKDTANTLDATCNYWDHATGPDVAGNHPGKGVGILGAVDYRPWNVRRIGRGQNPEHSCVGGRENDRGN